MNDIQRASSMLEAVRVVYEAVAAAGPDGVAAGAVYAALMGQGCTMEQWEQIEELLTRSGLVTKRAHRLIANTPGGSR